MQEHLNSLLAPFMVEGENPGRLQPALQHTETTHACGFARRQILFPDAVMEQDLSGWLDQTVCGPIHLAWRIVSEAGKLCAKPKAAAAVAAWC